MMNAFYSIYCMFFILLFCGFSNGQNAKGLADRCQYPEGIYKTKEDFLNKTPSEVIILIAAENTLIHTDGDKIPDQFIFLDSLTDKKVKNAFAISHKNYLYFQLGHITLPKNRNSKDKGQMVDLSMIRYFSRVKLVGKNYLYTEVILTSGWGYAFEAQTRINTSENIVKGVVWDIPKEEFNIFRNCKDFNSFLSNVLPNDVMHCEGKWVDIESVREKVRLIK